MSNTRHTLGPWKSCFDGTQVRSADSNLVAETVSPAGNRYKDRAPLEQEANARLIAAAPELADALNGLTTELETWHFPTSCKAARYLSRARAALKKAGL